MALTIYRNQKILACCNILDQWLERDDWRKFFIYMFC